MTSTLANPCLTCGACCATFRVSFYWGETDAAPGGTVPADLTTSVSPFHVAMRGTDQPQPRCIALDGTIGQQVRCSIYPRRSSTCRAFAYSWEHGQPEPACERARAKHGLPPLPKHSFPRN